MPGRRPIRKRRSVKRRPETLDVLLERHRERLTAKHRVRNADQLVKMVNAVGMCFAFTPAEGLPIPACFDHLSTNDTDRKWGWMWGWKDELAEEKRLYYGPVLARKPTFVSMRFLPVLYATFGRAGEPDDHVEDARAGRLSDIARRIIEFVTQKGESQTRRMRAELGITSKEGKGHYEKALDDVQRLMYVARVKAVGEGREEYNYTYDLFVRRYPEVVKAAEPIASADARGRALARAAELAGGLTEKQAAKLFDWGDEPLRRTITRIIERKVVVRRGQGRDAILVLPAYADAA
jgi:hypothetical protein